MENEKSLIIDDSLFIEAFEILGANEYAARFYIYLLQHKEAKLDDIPIPFNRKMQTLEFLQSRKWIISRNSPYGISYMAKNPQLIFGPSIDEKNADIRKMQAVLTQFQLMSQKDSVTALTDSEEFYKAEFDYIDKATTSIFIISSRFKLAWKALDRLAEKAKHGVNIRCLGKIVDAETAQRAVDLKERGIEVRSLRKIVLRFMVFDDVNVIFAIRNPDNPKTHIGTIIHSSQFAKPLLEEAGVRWEEGKDPSSLIASQLDYSQKG
ncbi:MAG: hypothetical protein ACXAC6_15255 [Candidatus Hodarchaeales archaeon]|jgi:sugar-specific transcriptional regulator TrmB